MLNQSGPIVVEQVYSTSINRLWEAITQPEQMRQWYFEIEDFQAVAGFETEFVVESGGRAFPHIWQVTEVVPGKTISYNWTYRGYTGDSDVTFELFAEEAGAKLRLTHRGIESFPQDVPEFRRESGVAGWRYFLCDQLKRFLEALP